MSFWFSFSSISTKPQPPPQMDMLSINTLLAIIIVLFLVLVSFGIGASITWMIAGKQKRPTPASGMISYHPQVHSSGWADNDAHSIAWETSERRDSYQSPDVLILPATKHVYEDPHPVKQDFPLPPVTPPLRKEDPLSNRRWLALAEECVNLFNELDELAPRVDAPRKEIIRHVEYRLQEILVRSGIEVISSDTTYDLHRHQPEPPHLDVAPGTPIVEIVSPGFAAGHLVLRPARIKVAAPSPGNFQEPGNI